MGSYDYSFHASLTRIQAFKKERERCYGREEIKLMNKLGLSNPYYAE